MDYSKAVGQISAIHDQLAKGEIYRGYRPVPVALSGVCGLAAAAAQSAVVPAGDARAWIVYWTGAAAVSGLVAGSETAFQYLWREPLHLRRQTHRVVAQFAPAVAAGALLALLALVGQPALTPYLPGLWALSFGLGVFASRPYLPRASGWVALYYLAAGAALTASADAGVPGGWSIGGVFAAGQLAAAAVLYANVERTIHGDHREEDGQD